MKQTPKQIKAEEKQMMLAFVLIIVVLLSFQFFTPRQNNSLESENMAQETIQPTETVIAKVAESKFEKQLEILSDSTKLPIQNEFVIGSLLPKSSVFNNLNLEKYKETTDEDSKDVSLLSNDYFTYLKWNLNNETLDFNTGWHVIKGDKLTPQTPVVLEWENSVVKVIREISLDDHYMFTIQDSIKNKIQQSISASLEGTIRIKKEESLLKRSSVHTGFVALINNKLQENSYSSVDNKVISYQTTGGWFGITQKYWQTIFIPDQNEKLQIEDTFLDDWYQSSFRTASQNISGSQTITKTIRFFAGAKDLDLINQYEKDLNIPKFDLTIDFGWFYFLTKPFLYFLQWLYALVGNMGIAILIFATLLRIALLPIVTKSYISMAKMKKIQPQIQVLQEKYKEDRPRLQKEVLALYAREHVSPAGGCLPMFIQIIPFYALYKVLSVSLQMRGAPFLGWIKDLSMPDPSSVLTLCGLIPWPVPNVINIGILPVIMGATMYIQQKLQPAPAGADKAQMGMFKWMPVIFTFMMGNFASGLVLYWTWSNILSIFQQRYINKKMG